MNFYDMQFQLGIDIGSSTVARGVVSLVLGYLNNLVIEMAFLIQVLQLYFPNVIFKFLYRDSYTTIKIRILNSVKNQFINTKIFSSIWTIENPKILCSRLYVCVPDNYSESTFFFNLFLIA